MNDLDALMTDIRHLIATWAARQVQAAVTPTPGERRGEPRRAYHFLVTAIKRGTPVGTIACNCLVNEDTVVTVEPAEVTCHSCMKTITYKTATARSDT